MSRLKERYVFDFKRILREDSYHIEYCITDVCNRSCAACSHLAPLAKNPNFVDTSEFERVTRAVQRCIPDAHTFWLTGGEPTLHPEFMRLLEIARAIYLGAYVGIYSNGSTLPRYESDVRFWDFVRENGIVWAITPYDGDRGYFEDLFARHDCGDNLTFVQSGKVFFNLTCYSENQPVTKEKYAKCGWERSKINIRGGKIYNCPSAEFADLFAEYFGIPLSAGEDDSLTVDDELTKEKIERFRGPTPFCSRCDPTRRYKKILRNEPSKRRPQEWSSYNEQKIQTIKNKEN